MLLLHLLVVLLPALVHLEAEVEQPALPGRHRRQLALANLRLLLLLALTRRLRPVPRRRSSARPVLPTLPLPFLPLLAPAAGEPLPNHVANRSGLHGHLLRALGLLGPLRRTFAIGLVHEHAQLAAV